MYVCTKVIVGGEIDNQPSFDILLGMDIISTGTLMIRNDGVFVFSFGETTVARSQPKFG